MASAAHGACPCTERAWVLTWNGGGAAAGAEGAGAGTAPAPRDVRGHGQDADCPGHRQACEGVKRGLTKGCIAAAVLAARVFVWLGR